MEMCGGEVMVKVMTGKLIDVGVCGGDGGSSEG